MILDGMHPLVRQIPPGSSLSMTAILILGFSRIKTSTKFIAEPEPMMIKSYSSMATPVLHRRWDEKGLHNMLGLRATLPGPGGGSEAHLALRTYRSSPSASGR